VVAEVNINTLPAVSSLILEDIAPSMLYTMNAQSLIAPEEVSQKKRGKAASLMSDSELTSMDKQRMRRASKAHNKKSSNDSSGNFTKQHHENGGDKKSGIYTTDHGLDDQLKRDSRVILTNSDGSFSKKARVDNGMHQHGADGNNNSSISYSKSSSFFSNLQEQTKQQIKSALETTTTPGKLVKDVKKSSSSSSSRSLML